MWATTTQLAGNETVENLRLASTGMDERAGDKRADDRTSTRHNTPKGTRAPQFTSLSVVGGGTRRSAWELGQ